MWKVPPPGRERTRRAHGLRQAVHRLAHAGRRGALRAVHGQEAFIIAMAILFGSNGTTAPLRRMIW
jgi:hypothetical protein